MSVPACPMPIQKTKLMMNDPQPTGWLTPKRPIPAYERLITPKTSTPRKTSATAEREPPPLRGELLGVHADVAVDVLPLLPAGDERLGDLEVAPVGAGPARTIGRPVSWPSSITVA